MKIHIAQRDDTFEVIANKYGVSVQDLIGMNTHINHLAGLVPGLKVKVPQTNRKEEGNVAQHIQKYYPNLDMNPIEVKKETVLQHKKSEVEVMEEEAVPVQMKPFPSEPATHPNEGVKLKETQSVAKEEINFKKEIKPQECLEEEGGAVAIEPMPTHEEYSHHHFHPHHHLPQYPHHQEPPLYPYPQPLSCQGGWDLGWSPEMEAASFYSSYSYPAPPGYLYPEPTSCSQSPYDMMRQEERFIVTPGWGWGYPFWGWGYPWGWNRPPGWGWNRPPGWGGGRPPGWGGGRPPGGGGGRPPGGGGGRPPGGGGGPHRAFEEFYPYPVY